MITEPVKSREVILGCLMAVLEENRMSSTVLSEALSSISGGKREDRAFITRVTEGVLERLITVDAGLNVISSVPVKDMKPLIREILRLSVYQILYMDRVPDRAAVDEAVKLARAHGFGGLSGFVNGVLRAAARNRGAFVFSDLSRRYSMPEWIIEKWEKAYGPEKTEMMLEGLLNVRPLSMHVMMSRTGCQSVMESLESDGVKSDLSPLSDRILILEGSERAEDLSAFRDGLIFAQDPASSLVGEAAGIQKDNLVVDVCAAPGGKSMDAADRLGGTGLVLACDRTEKKTGLIRENMARLGLSNVTARVWDAACYDERLDKKADVVIADLPCSGLGDIARKPEIKYRASEEECAGLITLQRGILSVANRYVKPGGRLIYSTCTVNREENEDQREWFLSNFPFHKMPLKLKSTEFSERETLKDGFLQLLPGIDPCDGFFLSVFVRE